MSVIIIGSGPAGVSAGLYTSRAGIQTTIISAGYGALENAEVVANYYGVIPISGKELFEKGKQQAINAGIQVIDGEVISITYSGKFMIKTNENEYLSDSVIIATGSKRKTPEIEGITEFEGKGISYCAVCDAFFCRGKDVAVLGEGDYALSEVKELVNIANSVTVLLNGNYPKVKFPDNVKIIDKKISAFTGKEERLSAILFDDGERLEVSGVFIALGVAGSTDLARKIGAVTDGNIINTDADMKTNIPGLFAAGDCTGGILQISKAVYDGAVAGIGAVKFIRGKKE